MISDAFLHVAVYVLHNAGLVLDYAIEKTIQNHALADPAGKVAACDSALAILGKLSDPLEKQLYIQRLAQRLGLQEQQVSSRMRGSRSGNTPGPKAQESEKRSDFHKNALRTLDKFGLEGFSKDEMLAAVE